MPKRLLTAATILLSFPSYAGPAEDKALIDAALALKPAAVAAALDAGADPNAISPHARPLTPLGAAVLGIAR